MVVITTTRVGGSPQHLWTIANIVILIVISRSQLIALEKQTISVRWELHQVDQRRLCKDSLRAFTRAQLLRAGCHPASASAGVLCFFEWQCRANFVSVAAGLASVRCENFAATLTSSCSCGPSEDGCPNLWPVETRAETTDLAADAGKQQGGYGGGNSPLEVLPACEACARWLPACGSASDRVLSQLLAVAASENTGN